MSEYNSNGRQKLDGYSLANLRSLTTEESEEAAKLLEAEAETFGGAIEALVYLNPELAFYRLKNIEKKLDQARLSRAYQLYYWLWKTGGGESYVKKYCNCNELVLPSQSVPFFSLAKEIKGSKTVFSMMQHQIVQPSDETITSIAADYILEESNIKKNDNKEEYLKKWKILYDGDLKEKNELLYSLSTHNP